MNRATGEALEKMVGWMVRVDSADGEGGPLEFVNIRKMADGEWAVMSEFGELVIPVQAAYADSRYIVAEKSWVKRIARMREHAYDDFHRQRDDDVEDAKADEVKSRVIKKAMMEMVGGTDFHVIGDGISRWYDTLLFAIDAHENRRDDEWVLLESGDATVIRVDEIQSLNVERHKIFLV